MRPKNFVLAMEIISTRHSNEIIINHTEPNGQVTTSQNNPTIHIVSCTAAVVNKLTEANFVLSMEKGMMSVEDYKI